MQETFRPRTECGGNDGADGRALRYLEWAWDPDPNDSTFVTDFAYLLRENDDTRVVHDRHIDGLFPRDTWLRLVTDIGFDVRSQSRLEGEDDPGEIFVAVRKL